MADAIAFLLSGFAMVVSFPPLDRASRQIRNVIVEEENIDYHNRHGADNEVYCITPRKAAWREVTPVKSAFCHSAAGRTPPGTVPAMVHEG
jgi:hypothetical protein